jgi:hypothetical protein
VITGTLKRNFDVLQEEGSFLLVEHLLEKKLYRLLSVKFGPDVGKDTIFKLVSKSTHAPTYVTSWLERDATDGDLVLFIQYE